MQMDAVEKSPSKWPRVDVSFGLLSTPKVQMITE